MKKIMLLIAFVISANTLANYGKYKLEMGWDWKEGDNVVFLMNSSSDVKIIEDNNYYTINSSQFFTEVTLDIESGGDEDYMVARAVLGQQNGKTVMYNFCAAMIDGPNSIASIIGDSTLRISKWNKRIKQYEQLEIVASDSDTEYCLDGLLKEYREQNFDIYEY